MERLTMRDENGDVRYRLDALKPFDNPPTLGREKLFAYEEAEEQGLIVRLPCKVGDTVYRIEYVLSENNPAGYVISVAERKFNLLLLDEFGKTVFLTREEAEATLAKEG